jgi:hypothetical protein
MSTGGPGRAAFTWAGLVPQFAKDLLGDQAPGAGVLVPGG